MRKLNTWPETIMRGVLIGAAVGASCVARLFFVLMSIDAVHDVPPGGVAEKVLGVVLVVLVSFTYAFFIWFAGILIFGLGPWWLLHRFGLRGRLAAAGLGFAVPMLLLALPSRGNAILEGCALGAAGILVAETIWYSAYKYGAGARETSAA